MGKSKEQKRNEQQRQATVDMTSRLVNERAFQPSPLEGEAADYFKGLQQNSQRANDQAFADYGDMMGNYRNMFGEASSRRPTSFNWERVNADRPEELGEAYGYLREAMPGYRDFASTGGYSAQDIQELRARGINPIRSAYGNTIRELSRANTLGGGAANYIAARSRAQRELPQQMADAMTTVNAGLADSIRQGKMFGLQGISNTGSTMGGLSSDEAGRMLQANLANSQGSLQAAGMTENARQAQWAERMGALNAQQGLYGTTPGMASMFGNQAMQGFQNRMGLEASRNNFGLGLIDANLRALGDAQQNQGTPWWRTALGIAGTVAPYAAMLSDKTKKDNISKPFSRKKITEGLKKLPLHTWKYKGDDTTHFGPMAQDLKKHLGVGDGKKVHLVDIAGIMLASAKAEAMS